MKETAEVLQDNAKKKTISLQTDISEDMFVTADKDMLSTVIRNLVSNSIKFTHKEGTVKISSVLKQAKLSQNIMFKDHRGRAFKYDLSGQCPDNGFLHVIIAAVGIN